jgi:hypothetical protein
MIKVKRKLNGAGVQQRQQRTESKQPVAVVPRISKLMALAIHFDRLLRSGEIADVNELAELCHVTQPRISQILALNMLAPEIQEQLLFLPEAVAGRPAIRERMLRPIAAEADWGRQREMWLVSDNRIELRRWERSKRPKQSV